MEFRLLGPLEVFDRERPVGLGGPRQRALLAMLLVHANEPVAADRLLEELWAAPGAKNALEAAVSRIRRGPLRERLETRPAGYLLRVEPGELDSTRFEDMLAQGRAALAAGEHALASETLREALSLFRGEPLTDFRYEPFAQGEIARLKELRLQTLEERIEGDLALGRAEELVPELELLIEAHHLRERLRAKLMLCLYRSGRQADALALYRGTRATLLEELGLEPGPELRELERAILRQDAALRLAPLPRAPAAPARKLVTVLAVELPGLAHVVDPEAERALTDRALARATPVLARHGGRIVPFGRGRLLAVLGLPAAHEDDALRAARASLELNGELTDPGGPSIGIATGELLVADAERLDLTGEAVGHAVALAGEAGPRAVLLDDETRQLAAAALELEPANGAWRLVAVRGAARPLPLRLETPFVGRKTELERLEAAFTRTVKERSCRLVTVLGEAGIGKTRLAYEIGVALAQKATVLSGRCLHYGEGITFWPLRELVLHAGAAESSRDQIAALMQGEEDAAFVADQLAAALGLAEGALATDDIFWAVRRLLETLARRRPLLVTLEDLHWAEPTFLDLVQYLAGKTAAPLLLLALARPELLEARPTWGEGREAIELAPLPEDESASLVASAAKALPTSARVRVLEAAEGNPLFLEQLAAWRAEHPVGDGEQPLPPTIQALLAARLERLGPGERTFLECAAIAGKEFWLDATAELLPDDARLFVPRHSQALVRKGFIQPQPSSRSFGEFRFRHILIQQAAYRAMPKAVRADLHERFADLLERETGDRGTEYDEILGYHLEQSVGYLAELGQSSETGDLARRGALRLAAAGARASEREDYPAAVRLLSRALDLVPDHDGLRRHVLTQLGGAVAALGEVARGERLLSDAIKEAAGAGDRLGETWARIELAGLRTFSEPSDFTTQRREAERALEVFAEAGDERGLARAWSLLAWVERADGNLPESEDGYTRCLQHARRAGDSGAEVEALRRLAALARVGPTPVGVAVARCEEILGLVAGRPTAEGSALIELGVLRAFQGRFDEARELLERGRDLIRDSGAEMAAAWTSQGIAQAELSAGDPVAAERELRPALEAYERFGNSSDLAFTAIMLADALCGQGRYEEAVELVSPAEDWHSFLQARADAVRGRALAGLGRLEEAEHVARKAVASLDQTEVLVQRARAHLWLAEILRAAGRTAEAVEHAEGALRLYEQKGVDASVHDAGRLLEELKESGGHPKPPFRRRQASG
jgi:DNA-binding SARP family transcriptional activator/tetratricopeptide (TPR) repeat protein